MLRRESTVAHWQEQRRSPTSNPWKSEVLFAKGVLNMLVLTRKNQESVVVGGSDTLEQLLKVTVLEIRRGKVKLGIEGDKEVGVYRCEIWDRMRAGARRRKARTCA
jgi:carbon storage regulator CsrA